MNKDTKKKKKNTHHNPKKDSIEIHGELIYKSHPEEIDADEIYHDPKVPGKYAGDC